MTIWAASSGVDFYDETHTLAGSQHSKYDASTGQLIAQIDAEGRATGFEYDAQGRMTHQRLGGTWNETSGAVTGGQVFEFAYDAYGNQTRFTNPRGAARTKYYDDQGRLVREFGPQFASTEEAAKANRYPVTAYEYDARGRLFKRTEGLTAVNATLSAATAVAESPRWMSQTYDPWTGALATVTFSDGRRITHAYDDYNRLTRVEVYQNTTAGEVLGHWRALVYDAATGRVASVASPEGVIRYNYNDKGELVSIKNPSGTEAEYFRDAWGRLATVRWTRAGQSAQSVRYVYDAQGRRQNVVRSNGVATTYGYDAQGRLDTITHAGASGTLLALDYTRDATGLIKDVAEQRASQPAAAWDYGYDSLKRLTTATRTVTGGGADAYVYTYDGAGNRLTKSVSINGAAATVTTYTYNAQDQLLTDGTNTYAYDAYGNLCYEKNGADILRHYEWNASNHLLKCTLNPGDQDEQTVAFGYNDQGDRVKRQVNSDPATKYLTDNQNPSGYSQSLAELDTSGAVVQKEYLYAESVAPNVESDKNGSISCLHDDHQGSTRLLTDEDGSVKNNSTYNYTLYGESLDGATEDRSLTTYAFTGQTRDPDLGLQYHRTRWLDTDHSCWLAEDPFFDYPENYGNSYGYASCCPVNYVDWSGLDAYAIYRPMGNMFRKGWPAIGHVYLAFDDKNMSPNGKWSQILNRYHFKKGEYSDTPGGRTYEDWITFSFHPRSVGNNSDDGNLVFTIYTDGNYIALNDHKPDIKDINTYTKSVITSVEEEQVRLFTTCMQSYNNLSAYHNYAVTASNCGGWAYNMVSYSELTWPYKARLFNSGSNTGGPLDFIGVGDIAYVSANAGYNALQMMKNGGVGEKIVAIPSAGIVITVVGEALQFSA